MLAKAALDELTNVHKRDKIKRISELNIHELHGGHIFLLFTSLSCDKAVKKKKTFRPHVTIGSACIITHQSGVK